MYMFDKGLQFENSRSLQGLKTWNRQKVNNCLFLQILAFIMAPVATQMALTDATAHRPRQERTVN